MIVQKLNAWWRRLPSEDAAQRGAAQRAPLYIRSAGLCCSVGYELAAAHACIAAGMDHFQHSHFKTHTGERVLVAAMPERRLWGASRLAIWLTKAMEDCLKGRPGLDPSRVAVVWLAPDRPEYPLEGNQWDATFTRAVEALNLSFHPESGVLPLGRAGLSDALAQAQRLLQTPEVDAVLLAGVDSLIDAATISRLMGEERLLVQQNSDGFIPGEAAATVLLQQERPDPAESAVCILGHASSQEEGRVDGSTPSRAQGLTRALRAALAEAELDYRDLDFRCSDQNGEAFYSREAANAMSRIAPSGGDALALLTLCDSLGEVGAALGPAMLAYLSRSMLHPLSPGACGVLHLASDDGRRAAVVVATV